MRRPARLTVTSLTVAACQAPDSGYLAKGSQWWFGDCRNVLFNNYLTPNSKFLSDCEGGNYHMPGWKAARSNHPGGANVMYADGHVGFIRDTVNPNTWSALGTRDNGEVILRAVTAPATTARAAFARVRGSANALQFKDMGTDEFMAFLRA